MKMKSKILSLTVLVMLGFVGALYVPLVSSGGYEEISDEIYLEDVNVLVIGRCRIIGSDGTWHGGLCRGFLPYAEVETSQTPLERMFVIVYNETILIPWMTFSRLNYAYVGFGDVDGTLFWGREGSGASLIPPFVFVHCHARDVFINIG